MDEKKTHAYIAIAGNIGVGKTTMTKLLCERFAWYGFLEKVVENPYLEDFYHNMPAWAFQSQIFFLKERLKDHHQIHHIQQTCVQDRTIFEDAEIFARNLFERKIMTPRDYAVYRELYEAVKGFLRTPDLFIYLRASAWTLVSRIRKRGREYEQHIDKEYLLQLNKLYNEWAVEQAKTQRVLIIDTDHYDVDRDPDWREGIIAEIASLVGESGTE
ncbi:MAG: deoxynucleoside kinase [Deferribacteres bacterium]|nr:deoxynucleoside kinase [candidate division KSB1 bacterium]MCB9510769.1 deoxynucleoside kinase [Deferribacteres bacterium]